MDNEQQTPENTEAPAVPANKAPVRRSRAKKVTEPATAATAARTPSLLDGISAEPAATGAEPAATGAEPAAAPARRAPRRRASAPVTAPAPLDGQGELSLTTDGSARDAAETAAQETVPAVKAPTRRTRSAKAPVTKVAAASHAQTLQEPQTLPEPQAAPETNSSSGTAAAATPAAEPTSIPASAAAAPAAEAAAEKAAKAPARRATRRTSSPAKEIVAPAANDAPAGNVAPASNEAPVSNAAQAVAPLEEVPATNEAPAARSTRSRRRSTARQVPVEEAATTAPPAVEHAVSGAAGGPKAEAAKAEAATAEPAPAEPQATQARQAPHPAEAAETPNDAPAPEPLFRAPGAGMSALFLAPDLSLAVPATPAAPGRDDDEDAEHDGDRRGRGRNRNRRPRANDADTTDTDAEDTDSEDDAEAMDDGVTSRRRRRRRRGDADLELTGGSDEDPPNTVTRVRAPRPPAESTSINRVTSLRGSTRLEAKKQRRRDSRDSGRRRTVITEAEFLARRESVDRVMVVRQSDDRIQIGVLEDGILAEHFVSKTQQDSLIGNVYLGKVQNVLPSMEAAFVDIGRGRNAVLYAGEVDWDGANLNGQPRRIENALKSGDSVLVQVSKDPVGHKGARLTSQISLPGRYLVFVPGGSMTGISRKLPDVERNRLKRVLKDHLPENAGVIVRTAAEGASEEELTNDINRLRAQWEGINERASSTKALSPEMLYGEPDLTIKVVRDVFNEDFTKLIVSGEDAWDTIEAYVTYVAPDLLDRLEKWSKPDDIFQAHRIDEQINKALERKVFLPSGGSLVIDRTEAMTVVDVNTGKFTGSGGNLEETVTKNNLEAAEEVVRQLRLRDIGGIIVIDFIDMVLELNRDLVLRRLVECLGRDRTKHQVAEVTSLGLVQMTRKRMGTGLLEVFGEQCSTCAGRGMVIHEIPVEHRRTHSPGLEAAHAHAPRHEHREAERTANRSTRSERKRNRNRSMLEDNEQHEGAPAVEAEEPTEAQKTQKAHEARAALANIAAASQHEHDAAAAPGAAAAAGPVEAAESPEAHDGATLTLGGEAIELPRGHRSESNDSAQSHQAEQAAALAGLAQALDQLASPDRDAEAGDEQESAGGARSRARRSRRNRSARSAQGGADMVVETSDASDAKPSGQAGQVSVRHSTPVKEAVPAQENPAQENPAQENPAQVLQAPAAKKNSEPIILGVGVPASEL